MNRSIEFRAQSPFFTAGTGGRVGGQNGHAPCLNSALGAGGFGKVTGVAAGDRAATIVSALKAIASKPTADRCFASMGRYLPEARTRLVAAARWVGRGNADLDSSVPRGLLASFCPAKSGLFTCSRYGKCVEEARVYGAPLFLPRR